MLCCTALRNRLLPATMSMLMQARSKAAAEQQEQLRQLATDDALKAANQHLQEQVEQLQEQLDAATALQRSTQVRCNWCFYCACRG